MKKLYVVGFLVLFLMAVANSILWSGAGVNGFVDDYNRANQKIGEFGDNLTVLFNEGVYINDSTLYFNETVSPNRVQFNSSSANVNFTHEELELRVKIEQSTDGGGHEFFITDELAFRINVISINRTNIFLSNAAILTGTDTFTINQNQFYNVSLKFNWTANSTEWFVDDVGVGNLTFQFHGNAGAGMTRFGVLRFESISSSRNVSYDYIQWGTKSGDDITLESPEDSIKFLSSNLPLEFNCSVAGLGTNTQNLSLFIDGTRNFTNATTGAFINLSIDRSPAVGKHNWTCESYDVSVTPIRTMLANRTFEIVNTLENSQNFSNITTEGSTEIFTINITTDGTSISTGNLIYNNTLFSGSLNKNGNEYVITRELIIPNILAKDNLTFFWNLTLSDDSNFKSIVNEQEVRVLSIDDCSVETLMILNYTQRDEETQAQINGTAFNSTIEIDLDIYALGDRSASLLNFSRVFGNQSNATVCLGEKILDGTQKYEMDVQVRYDADTYENEFHHLQNFSLTNSSSIPQNIVLYDLKTVDSTEFIIIFKDSTFLPVSNALIDITRKYTGEGLFKTVEIPKTDADGQAKGHFDTDNVLYTITVTKDGRLLASFENVAVFCEDAIIGDCKLNLNAGSTSTDIKDWDIFNLLTYVFNFNLGTQTVTLTFNVIDGSTKNVELNTTKFDRFQNLTVCSDRLLSSAGTLNCIVPSSYGNITIISELYADGELVTTRTFNIRPQPSDTFGTEGAFLVIIMLITIPFLFITDKIGMIIGIFIGIITGSLLLMFNGGSFLGVGSFLIWGILAGGIIIWKISKDE